MIKSVILKNFMGYSEFKSNEFAAVNVIIRQKRHWQNRLAKVTLCICQDN